MYQRTTAALASYSLPAFVPPVLVNGLSVDSAYLNRLVRRDELIKKVACSSLGTSSYLWYYNELNTDKTSKQYDQVGTGVLQGITLESDNERVARCVETTKTRIGQLVK